MSVDFENPGWISVWMGLTEQTPDEFHAYFKSLDHPQEQSGINDDLGVAFVDVDLFAARCFEPGVTSVFPFPEIFNELPTSSTDMDERIFERCRALGLLEVNAFFSIGAFAFSEREEGRLYNGLRFIGAFDDE